LPCICDCGFRQMPTHNDRKRSEESLTKATKDRIAVGIHLNNVVTFASFV